MKQKMLHLYCGNGKGKTTAAVGLAVRARGAGMKVVFAQFLKDGTSAELKQLKQMGVCVFSGNEPIKFTFQMSDDEKKAEKRRQTAMLQKAVEIPCDMLILDEACAAWQCDLVDRELLQKIVQSEKRTKEIVLTGRDPAEWMQEEADYITEMRCCRHPFDKGCASRKGIEY